VGAEALLQGVASHTQHPELVGKRSDRAEQHLWKILRPAKGIAHYMNAAGMANERSGMKRHEIQRRIVEHLARFRVAGEKDLKSAIKLKALDAIRADTPSDAV
jgi:hypothetical protein